MIHRMFNGDGRHRLSNNLGRTLRFHSGFKGSRWLVYGAAHKGFGRLRAMRFENLAGLARFSMNTRAGRMENFWPNNFCGPGLCMAHHAVKALPANQRPRRCQRLHYIGMAFTEQSAGNCVVAFAVELNDVVVPHLPSFNAISVSYI